MRIGIDGRVIQDHFPGIGRYTFNVVRAMSGFPNVDILLFVDDSRQATHLDVRELAGPNVSIVPLKQSIFSPVAQLRAGREIRRHGLDIWHSPYYLEPIGLQTSRVVTIHDCYPLRYPDSLPTLRARFLYRVLLSRAAHGADRVIVDSAWVCSELERYKIRTKKPAVAIHLAADKASAATSVANREPADPILLSVGSDKPLKNFPMLVTAYAGSGVDLPLVIAGPRDSRFSGTDETIVGLGVGASIRRPGSVSASELARLYQSSVIFLFPSLAEGFGLPPLEAMTEGLPVICSNASSLPEVTGDAAISLSGEDVEAWSCAIRDLVKSKDLRAELREKSLKQAAKFSWRRTAEQTLSVYEDVLA